MTVSVKRNKVQYTGDNSTTAFSVTFPYTETSQVKVYLGSTLQTITTHYTLTDPGATGTVTFLTPPGTGVNVSLIRETDYLQGVDYVNNDALDAETLEKAFDKLTMMCQQLDNKIDGSVGFDETVAGTTSLKLASDATDLAGKLLAFDDSGNFVTTQEIGTFRGTDTTSTTSDYVVRDLIRDSSNDNVYFTKVDAPSGTLLTNTSYFELLVDVATVRTLKVAAETARTGAETAETNAAASLASFQGQYKTGSSDPYSGSADAGDLWYDTSASILKYYTGSAFEPVTTSLATVTDNYLTISNQVITAGTVPVSLGGTGATTASGARTALGLGTAATSATGDFEASGAVSTHAAVTSSVHGISTFGATLVDDADAATARTTLGLGTAATTAASAYATAAQGTLADSATQPGDNATTLNVSATDKLLGRSTAGAGSVEEITLTSAGRALLDDADAAAQRTTLGLGTAATTAATDYATSAQGTTADSALQDLVDDTTPQLGGNLDVNGSSIVSVSAGNIAITPDTTGKIVLDGLSWPTADGSADQVLKTDGAGNLSFVDQSGGGGLSDLEHADSITTAETISAGNHRFYVGPVSFSNTVTIAGKLLVFDGLLNTTGTINTTGTLSVR